MSKNDRAPRPEGNSRGPLRETRNKITFPVEDPVYEALVAMRAQTSLGPDANAGLLLHKLVTSPETIAAFLALLVPPQAPAPGSALEPPTDLTARRERTKP